MYLENSNLSIPRAYTRSWHMFLSMVVLIAFFQVVTPTQLDWLVPMNAAKPAEVALEPMVMAFQPDVVTEVSDLWSWHAVQLPVYHNGAPTANSLWAEPSSLVVDTNSATQAGAETLYEANIRPNRDNVARFEDGQVSVFVEHGTFDAGTQIVFQPIDVASIASDAQAETIFMRFQVEAVDHSGAMIEGFDQPVRLILDLNQLGVDLSEGHEELFVAYQDEEDPNVWHHVDINVHANASVITADVDHFSNWIAGQRPTAWELTWSPPVASEFSGSVNYSYPIDVPPGRAGLQPNVALSYNSRNMDGHVSSLGRGDVAHGWSIAQMSIMRSQVQMTSRSGGKGRMNHPHEFSVVIDGTGYDLVLKNGNQSNSLLSESQGGVEYFARDNMSLRVFRYYEENGEENDRKTYWKVQNGNGTTYTFGDSAESETWQCIRDSQVNSNAVDFVVGGANLGMMYGNCPTHYKQVGSPIGWYLTQAEDQFGNVMTYHYMDQVAMRDSINAGHNGDILTKKIRISDIRYNYENSSTLSGPTSHIQFKPQVLDGSNNVPPINEIKVFHGITSVYQSYPRYQGSYHLNVSTKTHTSNSCGAEGGSIQGHRLNTIQFQNPSGQYLPPTQFIYNWKNHVNQEGVDPCLFYYYLAEYKNGYGGRVQYTYEADGRQVSSEGWKMGYSYRVKDITVYDGNNKVNKTTYDYQHPCYLQHTEWAVPDTGNNNICHAQPFDEDGNFPQYAPLMGHKKVSVTVDDLTDGVGDPVARTIHTFHAAPNAWDRVDNLNGIAHVDHELVLGKPIEVVSGYPSAGDVWQVNKNFAYNETKTTYRTTTGWSGGRHYRPIESTTSTQYQGGSHSANGSQSTKTVYQYETTYGLVTATRQYLNGSNTVYRTNLKSYTHDTDNWLIGLISKDRMYEGQQTNIDSNTRLLSETRYEYKSGYSVVETVKQGKINASIPGSSNGLLVSSTQYDSYGNVIETVDPAGLKTSITYDSELGLYPVKMQVDPDGLDHTTEFAFYGFKDASGARVSGGTKLVGSLYEVTDQNGRKGRYEYDMFGRLTKTYGPVDIATGTPAATYIYTQYAHDGYNRPLTIMTPKAGFGLPSTRQYFNGLGQAIQSQTLNVDVNGANKNVFTITELNGLGQPVCQSVPVTYSGTVRYQGGDCDTFDHTETTYFPEAPGKMVVKAPDGSSITRYDSTIRNKFWNTNEVDEDNPNKAFRLNSTTDANDHSQTQVIDELGRLVQVVEFGPKDSGLANLGTKPNGPITGAYPIYARTHYAYDELGNLVQVTDANGNESHMEYDPLGRKISMDDPDMGEWSYSYDISGNLVSQTDAKGQTLCFYYGDSLNRMTDKAVIAGQTCPTSAPAEGAAGWLASYLYDTRKIVNGVVYGDEKGQLTEVRWARQVSDGDVASDSSYEVDYELFAYDAYGRPTAHTRVLDGEPYTLKTTQFDALGRPLQTEMPDGELVTMTYDGEGAETLTASGTNLVTAVQYNERGQMTTLNRSGSEIDNTRYIYGDKSTNFRLQRIQHGLWGGSGSDPADYEFQYDAVGNIKVIWERGQQARDYNQRFSYDHLNRLVSATLYSHVPNPATYSATEQMEYHLTYGYDKIGNMTSRTERVGNASTTSSALVYPTAKSIRDGAGNYTATRPHAVGQVDNPGTNNDLGYTYDANGNMITRDGENGETYAQKFDPENRLIRVMDQNDGATTRFYYDSSGQRTMSVMPNGDTTYYPFPNYERTVEIGRISIYENDFSTNDWTRYAEDSTWAFYAAGGNAVGRSGAGDKSYSISNHTWGRITSDRFAVQPNRTYDISYWSRGAFDTETSMHQNVQAYISVYDIDGVGLMQERIDHKPISISWSQHSVAIDMPNGAVTAEIQLYAMYRSGWVTFDNVSAVKQGTTTNLVANPGFETANTGWTVTEHGGTWNFRGSAGNAAGISGKGHMISNVTWGRVGTDDIDVEAGPTYEFSFWARGAFETEINNNQAPTAFIYVYDKDGQQIYQGRATSQNVTTSWARHSGTFDMPAGAKTARIYLFNMYRSGWIAYDDISLIKQGTATNLVSNPGFEAGTQDWPYQIAYSATHIAIGTYGPNTPHSGQKALSISNLVVGSITSDRIDVTAGKIHELRFWARGEINEAISHGNQVASHISFFDTSGQRLATESAAGGSVPQNSAAWQEFAHTFTPPAGAVSAEVVLHSHYNSGWIAFDDVSIDELGTPREIIRRTYSLAGQPIATRVSGHPDPNQNGLFYIFTDHLGSANTLMGRDGSIADHQRFRPFGELETAPSTDITERGFTGHHENRDIGLTYMNARFYVPYVNRFATADTIVPDPTNSQAWNRYSYTYNNPIRFTDPSGHCIVGYSGEVRNGTSWGVSGTSTICKNTMSFYEEDVHGADRLREDADNYEYTETDKMTTDLSAGFTPGLETVSDLGTLFFGCGAGCWQTGIKDSRSDRLWAAGGLLLPVSGGVLKYSPEVARLTKVFRACNSFEAGTVVETINGPVPIEDIVLGEYVLAYNEETDEIGYYPVTYLINHVKNQMIYLTIDDELIVTTTEHPFYTAEGEWVDASELEAGDEIRTADWTTGTVESVYEVTRPQPMYNFTVDVAHTYFVGENRWLVHNSGSPMGPCGKTLSQIGHAVDWGYGVGGAEDLLKSIDVADDRFGRLLDDLIEGGITAEEARWAADYYRGLADGTIGNKQMQVSTPEVRAVLMDEVAKILDEINQ